MRSTNLVIFIFFLLSCALKAQKTYWVEDFSEKYSGKITVAPGQEGQIFKKGVLAVLDKKNNKVLLKIESEELTFDLDDKGRVLNQAFLPYGAQGPIIHDDFDFDGDKDFALLEGHNSCYHGPSFTVYLNKGKQWVHSPEFSNLAQSYCGMFSVDKEKKTLGTMTKSGCCWHQYATYKIINGIPKPILVEEEDAFEMPFITNKTTTWKGDKKEEKIFNYLDKKIEGFKALMSFRLEKNGKEVLLFQSLDDNLYYTLLKEKEEVEFKFPIEARRENIDFKLDHRQTSLNFWNGKTSYTIYEEREDSKAIKLGIQVKFNGKTYDLKGDLNSLEGSLINLLSIEAPNLHGN